MSVVTTSPSSGIDAVWANSGNALHLGANGTTNYVQIGTAGAVTVTDLAGVGTAFVTVDANGLLARGAATSTVAPADARYWLSETHASLPNGVSLGTLSSGLLYHAVSGSISTPAALALAAGNVVYGGASNAPTQDANFNYISGNLTIGATTQGVRFASVAGPAGVSGVFADTASSVVFIDHAVSNVVRIYAHTGDSLYLGAGGTGGAPGAIQIGTTGAVTVADLAGATTEVVTATSAGLLGRGAANTTYAHPSAYYFVSRSTNAPGNSVNFGALSTGLLYHSVTGAVSTPAALSLTTGNVVYGSSGIPAQDANFNYVGGNLTVGAGTQGVRFASVTSAQGISAVFADTTSILWIDHASTNVARLYAGTGDTLHLGAGGTGGAPAALAIGTTGSLTASSLTGATTELVTVTAAGLLGRGAANTNYAHPLAYYFVGRSTNAPSNAINFGALSSGLLYHSVSGSASTPAALALTSGNVVFGTSGNAPSQDSAFNYVSGNLTVGATPQGVRFASVTTAQGISAVFADTTSLLWIDHASTNVARIYAGTGDTLHIGANGAAGSPAAVVISTTGTVTVADLAGGTTEMVTATSTGLLGRGTANTHYASPAAYYLVSRSASAPPNSVNLGLLGNGILHHTVSGSVSTVTSTSIASGLIVIGAASGGGPGTDSAFSYVSGCLTMASSDGSSNTISLTQSATQRIVKSNGVLTIGTTGSTSFTLMGAGSTNLTIDPSFTTVHKKFAFAALAVSGVGDMGMDSGGRPLFWDGASRKVANTNDHGPYQFGFDGSMDASYTYWLFAGGTVALTGRAFQYPVARAAGHVTVAYNVSRNAMGAGTNYLHLTKNGTSIWTFASFTSGSPTGGSVVTNTFTYAAGDLLGIIFDTGVGSGTDLTCAVSVYLASSTP